MVKLTAELIEQAAQYTNAVRDRELDLRGESGVGRAVHPRVPPLFRASPRVRRAGGSAAQTCILGPNPGGLHRDRPA